MTLFHRFSFFILMMTLGLAVNGQGFKSLKDVDEKTKKHFEDGRKSAMAQAFGSAKSSYRKSLEITPGFQDAMLELAGIYYTQKNEDSCIHYLKEIKKINPNPTARVYFTLANIYYNQAEYELALAELEKYLSSDVKSAKSVEDANIKKANCLFAIQSKKNPRQFSPSRLSDSINTDLPEYLPSLSADEELLVFSRMIDRQEDLYFSQWVDGHWTKAQPLNGVNTSRFNEAGHCISADGKTIVFTGCNMPGGLGSCDLYISYFRNNTWSKPENLGAPVNTAGWESQPSLSTDGNVLYFSSERPGGYGFKDIWCSEKIPGGKWSAPKNLSAPVNTPRNDGSPFIHADNETLYFMSDGLPGMGGSDLFYTRRLDDKLWDIPVNLGYPINTLGNEGALVVNINGDKAYYTSTGQKALKDKDGIDNTDIYTFELDRSIRPKSVSFFKATVEDNISSKPVAANITMTSIQANRNFYTGKTADDGTALVTIPKGDQYGIQLTAKGYVFISESIMIPDSNDISRPFKATYKMERVKDAIGKSFLLKNIFFESGSTVLSITSDTEIKAIAAMMKENPEMVIQIDGHTDNIGEVKDNLLLSQNRAKSVVSELIKLGVAEKNIISKGFGESKPITDNTSDKGRKMNRRTEFTIIR